MKDVAKAEACLDVMDGIKRTADASKFDQTVGKSSGNSRRYLTRPQPCSSSIRGACTICIGVRGRKNGLRIRDHFTDIKDQMKSDVLSLSPWLA